jgi:tRNA-Thr(GGU) m(6)t(6)A37 methyltransferase TsaA
MEVIGYISSCYPDKFGTPRQSGLAPHSRGKINILPKFQPEESLVGLSGFSHLWILFEFHKNKQSRFHAKIHPPRLNGKTLGVFATRSPHRPNPIGLSLVEIEKIEKDGVWVRGLDLIEGTPVYDIKPYLPEIESKPQAQSGWVDQQKSEKINVLFSPEQLQQISKWSQEIGVEDLLNIIEETLSMDPRPLVYKGFEGTKSPHREIHAVRIFDGDIHFRFLNPNTLEITKICKFIVTNNSAIDSKLVIDQ